MNGLGNPYDAEAYKTPVGGSVLQKDLMRSLSGPDLVACIYMPGMGIRVFAELQTITYQTFRELGPVPTCGHVNPRGIVRGPRTIAGSMVFLFFDRHALMDILTYNERFNDWWALEQVNKLNTDDEWFKLHLREEAEKDPKYPRNPEYLITEEDLVPVEVRKEMAEDIYKINPGMTLNEEQVAQLQDENLTRLYYGYRSAVDALRNYEIEQVLTHGGKNKPGSIGPGTYLMDQQLEAILRGGRDNMFDVLQKMHGRYRRIMDQIEQAPGTWGHRNDQRSTLNTRLWDNFKDQMVPDALPPFNIILFGANESGVGVKAAIYGVHIQTDGATMSMEDLVTEGVCQYMATGIQVLDNIEAPWYQRRDIMKQMVKNTAMQNLVEMIQKRLSVVQDRIDQLERDRQTKKVRQEMTAQINALQWTGPIQIVQYGRRGPDDEIVPDGVVRIYWQAQEPAHPEVFSEMRVLYKDLVQPQIDAYYILVNGGYIPMSRVVRDLEGKFAGTTVKGEKVSALQFVRQAERFKEDWSGGANTAPWYYVALTVDELRAAVTETGAGEMQFTVTILYEATAVGGEPQLPNILAGTPTGPAEVDPQEVKVYSSPGIARGSIQTRVLFP